MAQGMIHSAVLSLWVLANLNSCSAEGTFSLLVPHGFISAHIGSTVLLPCGVSSSLDVTNYEVRWYRPHSYDTPILLYRDLQVQENPRHPQYQGRTSLVGDLQKGNVTLQLENLILADRGEYVCFVKSIEWYDRASVILNITVVGSPPLLSTAEVGEQVNVTCASDGWSPKPILTWRDKRGTQLKNTVEHHNTDSEGLVSVSSWLMFSPSESEWISCSVGLSNQEMREGRVLPLKPSVFKVDFVDDATLEPGVSPGWRAFIILLVFSLLIFSVTALLLIPKIRDRIFQKDSEPALVGHLEEQGNSEEQKNLVGEVTPPECQVYALKEEINAADAFTQTSEKYVLAEKLEIPDWEKMFTCKVAIRPNASTSFLEVGKKKSRVTCKSDVREKTGFVHVLCEERIRSGQYYWEITALTEPYNTKKPGDKYECPSSWYVGVTSKAAEKKSRVPLNPQYGYWVLHYDKERGYYVNDPSSENLTPVLVRDRFSKLGVFLDCEKNKLSFYDCDKKSHLYTFYNVDSTEPLIPVLSPGEKLQHTLGICQEKCVNCDELYS